jgi:glutaredoxin
MRTVTLAGKADCHLCDDAEALLRRLAPEFGFDLAKADIERDAGLEAKYRWAIPVVLLDDVEIARAPIREQRLRDALTDALAAAR